MSLWLCLYHHPSTTLPGHVVQFIHFIADPFAVWMPVHSFAKQTWAENIKFLCWYNLFRRNVYFCMFHLAHCKSLAVWMNRDWIISSCPFMCQTNLGLHWIEVNKSLCHVIPVAVSFLGVGCGVGGCFWCYTLFRSKCIFLFFSCVCYLVHFLHFRYQLSSFNIKLWWFTSFKKYKCLYLYVFYIC